MKIVIIITGGILLMRLGDVIYYKGFLDGLKAMRDRCEEYLNERRKDG